MRKLSIDLNSVEAKCLIVSIFFLSELIFSEGSLDIMGPQWLYLSIMVLVLLVLIAFFSKQSAQSFDLASTFPPGILILVFMLFAVFSIPDSINRVESMISISRWLVFVLCFFLMLQFNRNGLADLVDWLSPIVTIIVVCQCIHSLSIFFNTVPLSGLGKAILSMEGNTGNKNIFASSILLKFPFVIYLAFWGKSIPKLVSFSFLGICLYTILLLNARAAYLSLIIQFAILIHSYFVLRKRPSIMPAINPSAFFYLLMVLGIALAASYITINYYRSSSTFILSTYGTVFERLGSIDPGSEKGTGNRLSLFRTALSIIGEHPFNGVGIGNWKIASIPYEKLSNYDVVVNYHAHNDFLELAGEIGIPGCIAFFLLFPVCAYLYLLRSKQKAFEFLPIVPIAFMGISSYFIDSCFNFPSERPSILVSFAIWLSFFHISTSKKRIPSINTQAIRLNRLIHLFMFLLVLFSCFVSLRMYQSLKMQKKFFGYSYLYPGMGKLGIKDFDTYKTEIPNITQTTLPINELRAELLILDNQFDSSLAFLRKHTSVNPEIGYHDYLLSVVYLHKNNVDSALYFAQKAFDRRPLNIAHWRQLCYCASRNGDSLILNNAYNIYSRFRNDKLSFELYQSALENIRSQQRK